MQKHKKLNYNEKFAYVYADKRWIELRDAKRAEANWECEECLKKGKHRVADEVHHIVPIEVDITKAYDYTNLILVCKKCHREKHKKESEFAKFLKSQEEE
jgi:5-methylcytosine-specific restriction endonuclease McrA